MSALAFHLLSRDGTLSGMAGFLEVTRAGESLDSLLYALPPLPATLGSGDIERIRRLRARFAPSGSDTGDWDRLLEWLEAGRRVLVAR